MSAANGSRDALVVATRKSAGPTRSSSPRSDAFASGLLSLGLEPGDRVGIGRRNCANGRSRQFAKAKAGLILVNINSGRIA